MRMGFFSLWIAVLPGCKPDLGLEGTWVWGDLHAHSRWSFDGCEDASAGCTPRGALPAGDFFANAVEEGLDFVAITDHAEADQWWPDGEAGVSLDIWAHQVEQVAEAQGVLPIIGYEWTGYGADDDQGRPRGSHRTVLLNQGCAAARIGAFALEGAKPSESGAGVFTQAEGATIRSAPSGLWAALDEVTGCDHLRWLSFAHHSAYRTPQANDWTVEENAPTREQVVEILSEHGSSECKDPTAPRCGWMVNEAGGHHPAGSVQVALEQGHQLGFVAGTDAHDARPGSVLDGPSSVDQLEGEGLHGQFGGGGLTGVFIQEGLSIDTLFDGIQQRHTIATSGPRPSTMEVWAEGQDGELYAPGTVAPAEAFPLAIHVDMKVGVPPSESWMELVHEGSPDPTPGIGERSFVWDGSGGWAYLRIGLVLNDEEHRVWVSPWFIQ